MIKTVFFDIGNVLVFFSFPKMIEQLSSCVGIEPKEIQKGFFETDLREKYEKGKIQTEELYQIFQTKSPKSFSLQQFKAAFSDIFTPNKELLPLIQTLKKQGVELILLSNISSCHFDFVFQNYPIFQLFDQKVLSYEQGIWKPDPRIFQYALSIAKNRPEECFYTDDIPEFVLSARSVGLPAEVFTTAGNLKRLLIST